MAQLVRVYFRNTGVPASDQSFPAGAAFELALDVEFSGAEIGAGGLFRIIVTVRNFNTAVVITPAPIAPAPVSNTPVAIVAPVNQTFVYTIPAGTGVVGEFLEASVALVTGAVAYNPQTDVGFTQCVILPNA
jgi:hypothetical protein